MMYFSGEKERCVILGTYMIENGSTVRDTAHRFGISKSTVHKDVTEHLPHANPGLYEKVDELLQKNKQERHLRGGAATKLKYETMRSETIPATGIHK